MSEGAEEQGKWNTPKQKNGTPSWNPVIFSFVLKDLSIKILKKYLTSFRLRSSRPHAGAHHAYAPWQQHPHASHS